MSSNSFFPFFLGFMAFAGLALSFFIGVWIGSEIQDRINKAGRNK